MTVFVLLNPYRLISHDSKLKTLWLAFFKDEDEDATELEIDENNYDWRVLIFDSNT